MNLLILALQGSKILFLFNLPPLLPFLDELPDTAWLHFFIWLCVFCQLCQCLNIITGTILIYDKPHWTLFSWCCLRVRVDPGGEMFRCLCTWLDYPCSSRNATWDVLSLTARIDSKLNSTMVQLFTCDQIISGLRYIPSIHPTFSLWLLWSEGTL